jgi:hypothetical protein
LEEQIAIARAMVGRPPFVPHVTVLAVLLAAGCGKPPPPAAPPPKVSATALNRLLPLENATVYSYDTVTEPSGERGLLILEVRRPRPDMAELIVAGRTRRLIVNAHDIAHATGGFLLKEPLTVGATYKGDFGTVRVTSVDKAVTLPAGAYTGCLETTEEAVSADGEKRTVTLFCPGVGIAQRETEAEQEGLRATERITLKSFGPRFDPNAETR